MAICASISNGALVQNQTAIGQCTDYVILTAADYAQSVPVLTLTDTIALCGSVMTVWALAYGIKLLRRAL
jgi:hypothetical protein